MRKVVAIFVQYDEKKYPFASHYFINYLQMLKNTDVTLVVVDNSINTEVEFAFTEKRYIINGDNSLWEFSGWQRGLEFVHKNNIDYDAVIFGNDAFLAPANGKSDLADIINNTAINKCVCNNVMIGQLLPLNDVIGKIFVESYIRTHCFILSKKTIEKIKTIPTVGINFLNKCVSETVTDNEFLETAPIGAGIQQMIINSLTRLRHTLIDIKNNWDYFRMKTLAYLNEILLSARVEGKFNNG